MRSEAMTYGLTRDVIGARVFVDLAEGEYRAISSARELVQEVLSLEEKFDVLVSNYLEFEKTLNDMATDHMVRSDYGFQSLHDCRVLINLRVQNLLGACRLYLDHGAHHASNLNRAAPGVVPDFKAMCSEQYDGSSSYRIAEALRNHSQHRGFVIGSFSTGGSWVERDEQHRVDLHRIEIRIDFVALCEGARTKESVLKEVESFGIKADARPIFREYIERLGRIHDATRVALRSHLQSAEQLLDDAAAKYRSASSEQSNIGIVAVTRNSEGKWIERLPLLMEAIERRRHFEFRNSSLVNLPLRHVSSEPPPAKKRP
jgi:hypothetical protein